MSYILKYSSAVPVFSGKRKRRVSRMLSNEGRGRFCSNHSLNLSHFEGQILTQGQSCLQRSCLKQILSEVLDKHFQHGVEPFQGESGFDWVLRQVVHAAPQNPAASCSMKLREGRQVREIQTHRFSPGAALTDVLKILPLEFSVLGEVIGLGHRFWKFLQLFYSSLLTL